MSLQQAHCGRSYPCKQTRRGKSWRFLLKGPSTAGIARRAFCSCATGTAVIGEVGDQAIHGVERSPIADKTPLLPPRDHPGAPHLLEGKRKGGAGHSKFAPNVASHAARRTCHYQQ